MEININILFYILELNIKKELGFRLWKLFISMCQHGKSRGGGSLAGDDEGMIF